jgi:hypothetical protein
MKKFLALVAMILWSGLAAAQHSHGAMKGPNGGPMQDVVGVHVEMVISGNVVTFYLYDEANKPTSAQGFSGSVLLVSGGARETVPLVVSGAALMGQARSPLAAVGQMTLMLKNAAGKSGQAKF